MDASQKYYDVVGQELQDRQVVPGLWARAVAETGNEGAEARARYIKLRVADLVEEARIETERLQAARKRQAEAAKLQQSHTSRPAWAIFAGIALLLIITFSVILGVSQANHEVAVQGIISAAERASAFKNNPEAMKTLLHYYRATDLGTGKTDGEIISEITNLPPDKLLSLVNMEAAWRIRRASDPKPSN